MYRRKSLDICPVNNLVCSRQQRWIGDGSVGSAGHRVYVPDDGDDRIEVAAVVSSEVVHVGRKVAVTGHDDKSARFLDAT